VTHIRNKADISAKEGQFKEVIYIDNEYVAAPLHKLGKFLKAIGIGGWMTNMALKAPSNIAFEYELYKLLKIRINNNEFDLIHRISPVSPTIPSPIATWVSTPFILGPLNGSLPWPKQFDKEIKKEREFLIHVRNVYKYLPYCKKTFHRAVKILSAFKHLDKDVPDEDKEKIIRFNELGVDTEFYKPGEKANRPDKCCQFLFVGRLVPYKCPHVAILAFLNSKQLRANHRLVIVGDGPERRVLQELIDNNGLAHCIEIVGWKKQRDVARYMSEADVFVFPTIREVGGNVIIEAMSSGLPSIVPDYGGPSELVDEAIGIKIPLLNRDEFQDAYTVSMEELAVNTEKRQRLSINARKRALAEHSWSIKGAQIKKIYDDIKK